MLAFLWSFLIIANAELYCGEQKMNCKQGCSSGWYGSSRSDHGCCASFGDCGGNRLTCRNPCQDVLHCAAHANRCDNGSCKKICEHCNAPYKLDGNACVIPTTAIIQLTGYWRYIGSCNGECSHEVSVGASSEQGTEFSSEEAGSTYVESSATVSAEMEGVGGSATLTAGSEDSWSMTSAVTTAIGQSRGEAATVTCSVDDFPWANSGNTLSMWQYQYTAKSRDNGGVGVETYDWVCIPSALQIKPKCPPGPRYGGCLDAVCTKCPDFGLHESELPCADYHTNCPYWTYYCTSIWYADWMNDNCAKTCGFCTSGVADGEEAPEVPPEDQFPGEDATQEDWDTFFETHELPPVDTSSTRPGMQVSRGLMSENEIEESREGESGGSDSATFMKLGPMNEGVSGGLVAVTVVAVLIAFATCAYLARRVGTLKKQEATQMMEHMPAEHVASNTYDVITQ